MEILGIDPGLKACGVAFLGNKPPCWAHTIRPKSSGTDRFIEIAREIRVGFTVDVLVIERMQYYQGSPVDPDDLIQLSILSGAIIASVPHRVLLMPTPAQWKGQVPKKIHHQRLLKEMPWLKGASRDAFDAAGLAKYGERYALTLQR